VDQVLDIFRSSGFAQAAVVGRMQAGAAQVHVA
jgi:selenide,water dikinase